MPVKCIYKIILGDSFRNFTKKSFVDLPRNRKGHSPILLPRYRTWLNILKTQNFPLFNRLDMVFLAK